MLQSLPLDAIAAVAIPAVTLAGAFFGVKYGLNGARKDIGDIKAGVKELHTGQTDLRVKVAEVCTELKETKGWIGSIENRLERHIEIDT